MAIQDREPSCKCNIVTFNEDARVMVYLLVTSLVLLTQVDDISKCLPTPNRENSLTLCFCVDARVSLVSKD